jgi:uroporphyrinogen-III synthase
MSGALAGRGIVITRPAGEGQRLAALIREAGGEPLVYPAVEILEAADPRALDAVIDRLDEFHLAIFVSPSAVDKAMTQIQARRALPAGLRCAVIGPGSVRALARFGVTGALAPREQYDSEALLALPALQDVRGRRVVIFRGDGGREVLADTLTARGAQVQYAACYRRGKPAFDAAPLLAAWQRGNVAAVIITSSEGLRNFFAYIGAAGQALLRQTLVIVPHPRIGAAARELGVARVVESAAGDEALVQTLVRALCH